MDSSILSKSRIAIAAKPSSGLVPVSIAPIAGAQIQLQPQIINQVPMVNIKSKSKQAQQQQTTQPRTIIVNTNMNLFSQQQTLKTQPQGLIQTVNPNAQQFYQLINGFSTSSLQQSDQNRFILTQPLQIQAQNQNKPSQPTQPTTTLVTAIPTSDGQYIFQTVPNPNSQVDVQQQFINFLNSKTQSQQQIISLQQTNNQLGQLIHHNLVQQHQQAVYLNQIQPGVFANATMTNTQSACVTLNTSPGNVSITKNEALIKSETKMKKKAMSPSVNRENKAKRNELKNQSIGTLHLNLKLM